MRGYKIMRVSIPGHCTKRFTIPHATTYAVVATAAKIDERLHDLHAAQWESGVGCATVHSSQCMSQSGEVFVSCV